MARLTDDEIVDRLVTLAAVTRSIERLADRGGARCIWVWGPVDGVAIPEALAARPAAFHERATATIKESGGQVVDLIDAVPHRAFVTLTHFGIEGHVLMADLMEPVVRDAIP
jgi:hypothetical protein